MGVTSISPPALMSAESHGLRPVRFIHNPCPLPVKPAAVPGDTPNKRDGADPGNSHLQSPWGAAASSHVTHCS